MTIDAWSAQLETAALLGTGRREPPELPGELGLTVDEPDAQRALLAQAALADVLHRSGSAPTLAERVAPAPPETIASAGPAASQLLRLLLVQSPVPSDQRADLVISWLTTAAASRRRVPHELLVDVMGYARGSAAVRAVLPAAWGTRGRWLAAFVPGMKSVGAAKAVDDPDRLAENWRTLTPAVAAERLRMLSESEPEAAVALLTEVWGDLSAKERATQLGVLAGGVGAPAEPLLEQALDDGAVTVRETALTALDALPTSARATRMAERLRRMLRYSKGLLRSHLEVMVPEPDDGWRRDGLGPTTAADRIVATAPLTVWTELVGPPADVVKLLAKQPSVLDGLALATARQRDPRWSAALLPREASLAAYLEVPARHAWLVKAVPASTTSSPLIDVLSAQPTPWPEDVSGAVLTRIAEVETPPRLALGLARAIASNLPVGLLDRAQEVAVGLGDVPDQNVRDVLLHSIQYQRFHRSILEAFDG